MENPPREYYLAAVDGLFQQVRWREESLDEALALFHECMHNMARMIGPDHPSLGAHFLGYGQLLGERNRAAEAIPLLVEGLRISRPSKHDGWNAAPVVESLDRYVRRIACRPDAKAAEYATALSGADALVAEDQADANWHQLRGMVLYRLGRIDEAIVDLSAPAESTATSTRDLLAQRLAFLALAQHQSGDTATARLTLAELKELRTATDEKLGTDTLLISAEAERLASASAEGKDG